MNNVSGLQPSLMMQQYCNHPDLQATNYECQLEIEKLISHIGLYGEEAVLQFFKGKNDINGHYFEDVGNKVLRELIKKNTTFLLIFLLKKEAFLVLIN